MADEEKIWISLLRAVNVIGHNVISKEQLIALYRSLGYGNVRTHIQSGNVLFSYPAAEPAGITKEIESAIEKKFGGSVSVILRTPGELKQTIAANPFPAESQENPSRVLIGFFDRVPTEEAIQQMKPLACEPDRFRIVGGEVFCHYPNGSGRSKLTTGYFEKQLGLKVTMRNWRVVNKLLELAEEG